MTDLDKLEELAKAATPGEWFWTGGLEKGEASLDVAGSTQFVLSATGLHSEGFLSVDEADAEFIAAANPAAVLVLLAAHRAVLARIAKVEALHSPRTIQVVTGDCALGECEHDDECPTEAFEQCVACDALADRVSIYYEEENASVAAYPCATVRSLTEGENE